MQIYSISSIVSTTLLSAETIVLPCHAMNISLKGKNLIRTLEHERDRDSLYPILDQKTQLEVTEEVGRDAAAANGREEGDICPPPPISLSRLARGV